MAASFDEFPIVDPIVKSNGRLSDLWFDAIATFYQNLVGYLSQNGIFFPQINATLISQIEAPYTAIIGSPLGDLPDISGQTVFDTTNRVPKIFIITYAGPNVATATWRQFMLV